MCLPVCFVLHSGCLEPFCLWYGFVNFFVIIAIIAPVLLIGSTGLLSSCCFSSLSKDVVEMYRTDYPRNVIKC